MRLLLIGLLLTFCIGGFAAVTNNTINKHYSKIKTPFTKVSTKPNTKQNLQQFTKRVAPTIMIDFKQQDELNNWRITNDSVMGGKSTSTIFLGDEHGIFKGEISLENNGGFSSVFRAIDQLNQALDTVTIDVKGDGHTYQLRMAVNIEGYRLNYKHDFNTIAGQRETITFALADFQASFRGRKITNVPALTSEKICEVGFLITPKVSSNFALNIFQLTFSKT